jgi:hypothetical protein
VAARIDRSAGYFRAPPKDLDTTYRAYGGEICAALGWEPPWQMAHRFAADHRRDFEATHDRLFLRACELRAAHPALMATFPNHPESRLLNDSLGKRHFAARDTSFQFYIGPEDDVAVSEADAAASALEFRLGVTEYVDQLMYDVGPFNALTDPGGVADETATLVAAATAEQWARAIIPPSQIVFDDPGDGLTDCQAAPTQA